MELYHTVYEGADERQCFTKYLTLGGMPYLSNLRYDDAASRQYLGLVQLRRAERYYQSETISVMWICWRELLLI